MGLRATPLLLLKAQLQISNFLSQFWLPSTFTNLDEPSPFAAGFGEAFTAGEGAFSFSAMSTCVASAGFVIILVTGALSRSARARTPRQFFETKNTKTLVG